MNTAPIHFRVRKTRLQADETTPVRLYRQLRAYFSPAFLLESNNFEQARDSRSIIGVDPLLELQVEGGTLTTTNFTNADQQKISLENYQVFDAFQQQIQRVTYTEDPGPINGFFGFTSFDAYRFAEPTVKHAGGHEMLPCLHYFLFRFLLIFDHFHEHIDVVEFIAAGEEPLSDKLLLLLKKSPAEAEQFGAIKEETSTLTDQQYEQMITSAKSHCDLGDTFQLVLSRGYEQRFSGDDFQVYRELRRLNPSPYCFYFDFGAYRMFGASPEALLHVKAGQAVMRPIAGTYPVVGDEAIDDQSAADLLADPKENAEHRMLVDLARNDLSRSCYPVKVDFLRRIERYSHLMHIVSQVSGHLDEAVSPYQLYTQCFPAGTLSGAPKFKAIELIYTYEKAARGAYGGGLGYLSPTGEFDHCILIRSAVVHGDIISYRAGAGIVSASDTTSEREEVTHKTNALRRAIALAAESNRLANNPLQPIAKLSL